MNENLLSEVEIPDYELPPFLAKARKTGVMSRKGNEATQGITYEEYCRIVGNGQISRTVWQQLQQHGCKIIQL